MEDKSVLDHINALVAEEHQLRESGATADQHERLRTLEEQLDQCWDLLRQRRARSEFGENPNDAEVRSKSNVENYLQ